MIRPSLPALLAGFVLALALSGCALFRRHPPAPTATAHYTLGDPYQLGGVWYYPKDQTEYDSSGLAAIATDHDGLTADGEEVDQTALAASHHTLQLPAIVRVTNLENGRQVLLRLNDRGPANPGRLIGLTRHAANLLSAADGTQIRLQLDSEQTRTLTEQVGGGPSLAITAAPRAAVETQSLPPPPGVGQSTRARYGADAVQASTSSNETGARVPDRLPDQVFQGPASPGLIVLRASEFGRSDYAYRQAAQLAGLGASVDEVREGRGVRYRVKAGPFASVAEADKALDQARRAGVIDSRLVVE